MERLKQQLQAEEIRFVKNEPLSAHCTFKIGGPADVSFTVMLPLSSTSGSTRSSSMKIFAIFIESTEP